MTSDAVLGLAGPDVVVLVMVSLAMAMMTTQHAALDMGEFRPQSIIHHVEQAN